MTWVSLKDVPNNKSLSEGQYWTKIFEGDFIWRGTYDPLSTYGQYEAVRHKDSAYIATGNVVIAQGETPEISTAKWTQVFQATQPASIHPPNKLVVTDDNGDFSYVDLEHGNLVSTGTASADLKFELPPKTGALKKIHPIKLADSRHTYISAVIMSDDTIHTTGYASHPSNLVHGSNTTQSSMTYNQKYEDIPHTGRWCGIANGYSIMYCWTTTGELYVCGSHDSAPLVTGYTTPLVNLVKVPTMSNVKRVVVGGINDNMIVAVLTNDNRLYTAGYNASGCLGHGGAVNTKTLIEVTGFTGNIIDMEISESSSAVFVFQTELTNAENFWVLGSNPSGAFGHSGNKRVPFNLPGKHVKKFALGGGYRSECNLTLLLTSGKIVSAGENSHSTLGDNSDNDRTYWRDLYGGFSGYVDVIGRNAHAGSRLAITSIPGVLHGWGYSNSAANLGIAKATYRRPTPVYLPFTDPIKKMVMGMYHGSNGTVILTVKGDIYYSGYNGMRLGGNGLNTDYNGFRKIELDEHKVADFALTGYSSAQSLTMLTDKGILLTTGTASNGTLGTGSTNMHYFYDKPKFKQGI